MCAPSSCFFPSQSVSKSQVEPKEVLEIFPDSRVTETVVGDPFAARLTATFPALFVEEADGATGQEKKDYDHGARDYSKHSKDCVDHIPFLLLGLYHSGPVYLSILISALAEPYE